MKSKITGGEATLLFTKTVLKKYDVKYYRCNDTGFIQTEEPFWLDEAYSSAITKLDIGLASRNITLCERVGELLMRNINYKGIFLDYAGGYGLFTRLMRDKGFNFYNTDRYCQNLFAEHFDLADLPAGTAFEAATAFEVLEHLSDPVEEIKDILKFSDNVLFTTELQPADVAQISDWWYLSPETGQHVAFYNEAALGYIAKLLGFNFYSDGRFLHLFSKKTFKNDVLKPQRDSFLLRKAKKIIRKADEEIYTGIESLLMNDYQHIKKKLK